MTGLGPGQQAPLARGSCLTSAQELVVLLVLRIEAPSLQERAVAVQLLVVEATEALDDLLDLLRQAHRLGEDEVELRHFRPVQYVKAHADEDVLGLRLLLLYRAEAQTTVEVVLEVLQLVQNQPKRSRRVHLYVALRNALQVKGLVLLRRLELVVVEHLAERLYGHQRKLGQQVLHNRSKDLARLHQTEAEYVQIVRKVGLLQLPAQQVRRIEDLCQLHVSATRTNRDVRLEEVPVRRVEDIRLRAHFEKRSGNIGNAVYR